ITVPRTFTPCSVTAKPGRPPSHAGYDQIGAGLKNHSSTAPLLVIPLTPAWPSGVDQLSNADSPPAACCSTVHWPGWSDEPRWILPPSKDWPGLREIEPMESICSSKFP